MVYSVQCTHSTGFRISGLCPEFDTSPSIVYCQAHSAPPPCKRDLEGLPDLFEGLPLLPHVLRSDPDGLVHFRHCDSIRFVRPRTEPRGSESPSEEDHHCGDHHCGRRRQTRKLMPCASTPACLRVSASASALPLRFALLSPASAAHLQAQRRRARPPQPPPYRSSHNEQEVRSFEIRTGKIKSLVHCIYLCKTWALILENIATHY